MWYRLHGQADKNIQGVSLRMGDSKRGMGTSTTAIIDSQGYQMGPQMEAKARGRNLLKLLTHGVGPVEVCRSIVIHAYNPSRWVAEPEGMGVPDQYGLTMSQNKKNNKA